MSAREKAPAEKKLPEESGRKLRTLAHDLANAIETIMQASYLLAQMQLPDDARRWTEMVDKSAKECAKLNKEIRETLRTIT
jgi:hypothetical protein